MLLRDRIDVLPRVADQTLQRRGMDARRRGDPDHRRTAVGARRVVLLCIGAVLPVAELCVQIGLRLRINRQGFMLCRVVAELFEEFQALLHQIQGFYA